MSKIARKVLTVGDLPANPKGRHLPGGGYVEPVRPLIICSTGCSGEYSANPSDYWSLAKDAPLTCSVCSAPMRIVRKVTRFEEWETR